MQTTSHPQGPPLCFAQIRRSPTSPFGKAVGIALILLVILTWLFGDAVIWHVLGEHRPLEIAIPESGVSDGLAATGSTSTLRLCSRQSWEARFQNNSSGPMHDCHVVIDGQLTLSLVELGYPDNVMEAGEQLMLSSREDVVVLDSRSEFPAGTLDRRVPKDIVFSSNETGELRFQVLSSP